MKPRILHVIPTYNNPKTIASVVAALAQEVLSDILVVDDGSEISAQSLVENHFAEEGLDVSRLHFLTFPRNQGKGVALQHAFDWALEHDFTHVLSSDADGQHPATEVAKVRRRAEENPWAFVIGNRNMETSHVPDISKFGRKFSNFWVRYQTDLQISDSQSGLRCYPLVFLQNSKFFTRRFDFEIEVLIRLIWKQVEILEEPVEVVYHRPEDRVSHFDKLWDNARITLLNTILIVLSLLKEKTSPAKLAAAFGVGVFVGCTPFYGFHTLLVAGASFFFKLNFVAVYLGSHVSLPPFVPLLLSASALLGKWALGKGGAKAILVGTFMVGGILGPLSFFSAWAFLHSRQKRRSAPAWRGEQRGGRGGNAFLKFLMRALGLRAAYLCVMIFVVPYFYLFAGTARRSAQKYWKILEPDIGFFARQRKVLSQMYAFARILLDSVYISMRGPKVFGLESIGYDVLTSAIERNRGILMLTAHAGAWSVSARAISRHKFQKPFYVVRYEDRGLTLSKLQERSGAPREILVNSQSLPILEIRQVLQNGGIVSLMGDRPLGNRLDLVKFLGNWILVDLSPFRTALACESAVFFGFGFQSHFKEYFFQVGELVPLENGFEKDHIAKQLAQDFFKRLEWFVRKHPEQWFNWYDYFAVDQRALAALKGRAPVLRQRPDVMDNEQRVDRHRDVEPQL